VASTERSDVSGAEVPGETPPEVTPNDLLEAPLCGRRRTLTARTDCAFGVAVFCGAEGSGARGQGARVELLIRGETLSGMARAVEDEPEHRADVFSRLRPTTPKFSGTLVQIELAPAT
jgi:hypothetical protein